MIEVRWSVRASIDFNRILDAELDRNLDPANTYSTRIANSIEQLRTFPFAGAENASLQVRRLVVVGTPYSIYYRLISFDIEIATIRHGAQEPLHHVAVK